MEFVLDGKVAGAVQLKAGAAPMYVYENFANYPGIKMLTTEEVATMIPGVSESGFANTEIETENHAALGALPGGSCRRTRWKKSALRSS